jgi:dihydroorotase-like cyclic amidohydrolase
MCYQQSIQKEEKMDLIIKNCRIVRPTGIESASIGVDNGKIVSIADESILSSADNTIDAKGRYVIPGLVDEHCHEDMPAQLGWVSMEECFTMETSAAVIGGITTICPMGIGPSIVKYYEEAKPAYEKGSVCDVAIQFLASSLKHIEELPKCVDIGILTIGESGGYKPTVMDAASEISKVAQEYIDDGRMFLFMEAIAQFGPPGRFLLHAENIDIILHMIDMVKAEGRTDSAAWTAARPAWCEAEKLQTYCYMSKATGCPILIVHNTCKEAVEVIRRARAKGVDVVGETCPQYLTHTKDDFAQYPPIANVNPPFRDKEDNEALWDGIRDGTIETIGSDHAPWRSVDKGDNIMTSVMGVGNVQSTLLPAVITYGVLQGQISIGSDADIVILDMDKKIVPKTADMYSISDLNIYEITGAELQGWPAMVMIRGNVVAEDGKVIAKPGYGKYIPRKKM